MSFFGRFCGAAHSPGFFWNFEGGKSRILYDVIEVKMGLRRLSVLLSCLSFFCQVCYGDDEVSPLGNIGPLQPGKWATLGMERRYSN